MGESHSFTSINKIMQSVGIRRFISRFCTNKQILLMDSPYYDNEHHWIHQKGLQKKAYPFLGYEYLSMYTGPKEKLQKTTSFRGTIVWPLGNLIFAIPTALSKGPQSKPESLRYHYVYYILDTASPVSTLTQEAFNCLKGNEQFPFASYKQCFSCDFGRVRMRLYPSSIDQPVSDIPCRASNVNILGTDFLSIFSGFKVETNFSNRQASLQLK